MPGITGIIGSRIFDPNTHSEVDTMLRCLVHESPAVTGALRINELALQVAWADRPGSATASGPVWNLRHDICLILFGEICEIDSQVGDVTRTDNSLRILIDLYEKNPSLFPGALNGSFSGLLMDLRAEKVILFNDRYALGRINYHKSPGGFYFASEAKSLLAVHPHLRQIDQQGLAEFYSVGCVLQNRTLFSGISLLPAGSMWTFHPDGRIDKKRYFDPATWEQQEPLDEDTYSQRLAEVFGRIVPRYLRGTGQVALSLTGGLDSRMVLAWAHPAPESLPCYSFDGPYRDCADVRIARQLAKICRQAHTTIRIDDAFFENFPSLAEKTVHISDGTMDVSGAVELHVNRSARKIAPIRLTGNYGSEILRSNVAFRPGRLDLSVFTPEFCKHIEQAAETYRNEAVGHRLSFIAFKQVPWHHYARQSVEKSQLIPRSPFLDNELVALAYRAPPALATSAGPLLRLIAEGNPALAAVASDQALRFRALPVVTKLSKAWHKFTAKAEYAYDYGMPPWVARVDHRLAYLHLERLFLGRHKFYHFRVWYRDRLNGYVRSHGLESASQPGCYRDGAIGKIVNGHLSGRSNHTLELHKLFTVQLIDRLFVRQQCPN